MRKSEPSLPCWQYRNQSYQIMETEIITEAAVTLSVNGDSWLTFMCSPFDLDALAAGFLFNEGIISSRQEISVLSVCNNDTHVDVWLSHPTEKPELWLRTSGCSGGLSIPAAGRPVQVIAEDHCISPEALLHLMELLSKSQQLYQQTGGVHCSGLSDGFSLLSTMEDIGRHNTLDKLAGRILLDGANIQANILLTTGRTSAEMIQKSLRMGISIVVSRTSPTTLSIQIAQESGMTLVGYTRQHQFNVYTHPNRLMTPANSIPPKNG